MLSRRQIENRIAEARAARDAGIAQAEAADRFGWDRSLIDQAIGWFAQGVHPFSANDLREVLPTDVRQPLIGARFSAWATQGLIVRIGGETSTKRNTHCKRVSRWMGALDNPKPSPSSPAWVKAAVADYRAAHHVWEQLFEAETHFTYVPGIIEREKGKASRGGRREITDFIEDHPPPRFRDYLADHAGRQHAAETVDHTCDDEVDVEPQSQRCGRIDDHPQHDWRCGVCKVTYRCSGHVVIEGGARS